ncbi:hypothetical protein EMEDMD4_370119 [Sinorhizobium medicae]|uniref:Uncharacterized protein n=1 Tax=Sinorhizobium medicae TaxID=110321 RepID=A0A508WY43_9HYPH|nr:hypothetical protein EMEDMD4_370119 [Sinorhizobium medicae]
MRSGQLCRRDVVQPCANGTDEIRTKMWGKAWVFSQPRQKSKQFQLVLKATGGEGGIRTPDGLAPMPHFECGAFNHSATSPRGRLAL